MIVLQALLGLLALHLASWWASEDRARIPWRTVAVALGLQVALAAALTRLPAATTLFDLVAAAMGAVQAATESAMRFLFGYLAGGPAPFSVVDADAGYVLALRALPVIIVMSAVARVLTHWGVLPWLVRRLSALLERSLGIGGALGLSAAANVFVGMTEAPLLVRPYLAAMSRGELFALMGCGMATIAGTVFVLFSNILAPVVPGAAGHLLTASLMSLPAAIGICVMLVPPATATGAAAVAERDDHGSFDALAAGAGQGLKLYFNILAMLLVLLASVHLVNLVLGQVTVGGTALSLQRLFGWMFAPVCWLMGVPGRGAGRRRPARHQDHPQRAAGLSRSRPRPARDVRRAYPPHPHVRPVRLRQSRQPRHADGGARRTGAGAARRDHGARPARDRRRYPCHPQYRRGGRPGCAVSCRSMQRFVPGAATALNPRRARRTIVAGGTRHRPPAAGSD